ncbi:MULTISPECIES: hypothetical protein [Arcobacteraceae]|nr:MULTISPECIES: hypothetical protein [Arcobacteraceae]
MKTVFRTSIIITIISITLIGCGPRFWGHDGGHGSHSKGMSKHR